MTDLIDTSNSENEIRFDASLVNALTQMGTGGDKSEYTTIGNPELIPKEKLEKLYKIPICRRIVRAKPDAAITKGWHLTLGKEDLKIVSTFNKEHERLKVKNQFNEAQVLANIYGGATIIIIANDNKPANEPIDCKKLSKINSLQVLDRYKIEPVLQINTDISDPTYYRLILPDYLKAKFKSITPNDKNPGYYIHKSRVIRFDGVKYTPDMMEQNNGWGGSVLESLWEDYRDWKTALKSLGAMVHDSSLFMYKLKNLANMIKNKEVDLLKSRLILMRLMTSVFGGVALDLENENVEFSGRNFNGVDQVAVQLRDAFIGASGIPHDKLFGESPSGLGATGESESNNWSEEIASFQQTEWKPKLQKVFELIFNCKTGPTKGVIPDDWDIEFPPLKQMTEQETVTLRSTQASTDNTYLTAGVLLPEEVRQSRFGAAKYSVETTLDQKLFEKKQKEAEQQDQFGGFGGFGDEQQLPPEELPPEELSPEQKTDSIYRKDNAGFQESNKKPKKIVHWNNLAIGVTHEPGDIRFPLSTPMSASYGHIRRSYGEAQDGQAIDVYLGDRLESQQIYKVRQINPSTGMYDEDKVFIGFESPEAVRRCFINHAGMPRFGGIEKADLQEFNAYRQDNCSLSQPRLSTGVKVFPNMIDATSEAGISQAINSSFPEEVLKVGNWWVNEDGSTSGEFFTRLGVYGFSIKKNYCGYAWKRELGQEEQRIDSTQGAPKGYHWVKNKRVKGGRYLRKNPPSSDIEPTEKPLTKLKTGEGKNFAPIIAGSLVGGSLVIGGSLLAAGAIKQGNDKIKFERNSIHDDEGPDFEISENALEVDSEQEAKLRGAIINTVTQKISEGFEKIRNVHSLTGIPDFDVQLYMDKRTKNQGGGTTFVGREVPGSEALDLEFRGMRFNLATTENLLFTPGMQTGLVKDLVQLTTIHETGHAIDLNILGNNNKSFASAKTRKDFSNIENSADPEVADLVNLLTNSEGVQKIRRLTASANPELQEYGRYLLTPNELFARSYTQYIAEKLRDERLKSVIQDYGISPTGAENSGIGNGHWQPDEFNSTILPEFDRIFRRRGLLHE